MIRVVTAAAAVTGRPPSPDRPPDAAHPDELDELTRVRAARGDPSACRALVLRYQTPVFAVLTRLLGPRRRGLVEDFAQETFLRTFRALPGFDGAGTARLSSWILTIATRLALDELRRRRADTEPLGDDEEASPGGGDRPDETAARHDLGRAIDRALGALGADARAVLVLRELHDLEYAEIADALQVDLGTVKSRLSRARTALRMALAEVCDE